MIRPSHRLDLDRVLRSRVVMAVGFSPTAPRGALAAIRPWADERSGVLEIDEQRFARSWPRRPQHAYEAYDNLWPAFAADFSEFQSRLTAEGAPEARITCCELTYVNPVTVEEGWSRHSRLQELLVEWLGPELGGGILPPPDDVVTSATFRFPGPRQQPDGTLTTVLHALAGEVPEPLMGMTLSARGQVSEPDPEPDPELQLELGLDATEAWFHTAFEWVVRAYAALAPV